MVKGLAVDSEWDEDERFSAEMTRLRAKSGRAPDYARPFVRVFAVNGAAVSTLGDVLGNQTVSASDEQAARLDELQFD